jgi:hypothetical protein
MLVNSVHDPSDGYAWALGLYQEINNAVVFTRNGSGHASYVLNGESTAAENAYMLNSTISQPDTVVSS